MALFVGIDSEMMQLLYSIRSETMSVIDSNNRFLLISASDLKRIIIRSHRLQTRNISITTFSIFSTRRTIEEAGVEEKSAAFLISIIGITNTIGRFLVGWITDRFKLQPMNVNVSTLMIAGIATIAVPFTHSYQMAVAYAAVAGFFIAPFISLTSIILGEWKWRRCKTK